jgi:hypothetical protein
MQMFTIESVPDEVLLLILRLAILAYYRAPPRLGLFGPSHLPIPGTLLSVCGRFRRVLVTGASHLYITDPRQMHIEPFEGMGIHLCMGDVSSPPFLVNHAAPMRNALKYLPIVTKLSFLSTPMVTILDTLRRVTMMTKLTHVTLVKSSSPELHAQLALLAASSSLRHLQVSVEGILAPSTVGALRAITMLSSLNLSFDSPITITRPLVSALSAISELRINIAVDGFAADRLVRHVSRLSSLSGLRSLTILAEVDDKCFAAAASLPFLTSLSLSDLECDRPRRIHNVSAALVNFTAEVHEMNAMHLLETCIELRTQLTSLHLGAYLYDKDLSFVSHLTCLQQLQLVGEEADEEFPDLSANVLPMLANLTSLTRLCLDGLPASPTGGLLHIQHLTALKSLYLSGCCEIAGWDLLYLSRMRGLSLLILQQCDELSDYALQPLRLLPSLTDLTLVRAPRLYGHGLKELPSLTRVRLNACDALKSASVEHLTSLRLVEFSQSQAVTQLGGIPLAAADNCYTWRAPCAWYNT